MGKPVYPAYAKEMLALLILAPTQNIRTAMSTVMTVIIALALQAHAEVGTNVKVIL